MAKDDFFDEHNPMDWDPKIEHLLDSMPNYNQFMNDEMAQWLLDTAYFNQETTRADRGVARAWVEEYWIEEYGYIFHDAFDWAGYRDIVSP